MRVVDSSLLPLLSSAATYLDLFTAAFSNVVTVERYVQDVLVGGHLMVRPGASGEPRHRELRSDLVLIRTGDTLGWQSFRDVFEVDGAPVRNREERLAMLFERTAASAPDQAARLASASASYNIGAVERTINTPMLALLFLQPDHQSRFQFSRGTATTGFSDRVHVIDFREIVRPTVIRTVRDGDRPASGRLWIDTDTGAVLQTELVLSGDGVSIRFTTLFRHDNGLDVAVPVRMQEEYVLPSRKVVGVAVYDGFRRFRVSTDTEIGTQGRTPP